MSSNKTLSANLVSASTFDYAILIISVIIPFCIAIWTAFKGKKTTQDFFTANKSMGPFIVALSFLSTMMSAYMIIGFAGEVYAYGMEFSVVILGGLIGIPLFSYMNMNVFYNLQVSSIYEYLEKRFHSPGLRVCLVLMESLRMMLPMGIGLSGICLILSSVTNVDVNTYIIIIGILCATYATIGGMRGVIWTDAFMMVVIFLGLVTVNVLGILEIGPSEIWRIGSEGGRTKILNFNPSLFQRQNTYLVILHGIIQYGKNYSSGQMALQRALALKSFKNYKWVVLTIVCIFFVVKSLIFGSGLTAYAIYAGCDPISQGKIKKSEQILPYLISDKMGHIPGIAGLFLAAMVCAGVSTITSIMNVFTNLVYSDVLCKFDYFKQLSEYKAFIFCKVLTFFTFVPSIGIAIVATKAQSILSVVMILTGLFASPSFGVFFLGLLFPMTKLIGAVAGFFASFSILLWMAIGRVLYKPQDEILPLSADFCNSDGLNVTNLSEDANLFSAANNTLREIDDGTRSVRTMYDVSYLFFNVFGPLICVSVGLCVSFLTGAEKVENVPKEFISPLVRRFYYKKASSYDLQRENEMQTIDQQKVQNPISNPKS